MVEFYRDLDHVPKLKITRKFHFFPNIETLDLNDEIFTKHIQG